jgi:hypothetical protein
LVGDNEVHDRLFVFGRVGDRLEPLPIQPSLGLEPSEAPRDIEALALVGEDLVIVGSHSRGRTCAAGDKRKRRRILRVRVGAETLEPLARVSGRDAIEALQRPDATVETCLSELFVTPPPALAREVCASLLAAERQARPARCETLNIEGAIGVESRQGDRLWLGLRSPLVERKAALLRLADPTLTLRFDAVSLVDLGGLGIRALARSNGQLYGIAGDSIDTGRSQLWMGDLPSPGVRLPVKTLHALPAGAEGLAMSPTGDRALVVIDGEALGDDPTRCATPAMQIEVPQSPS